METNKKYLNLDDIFNDDDFGLIKEEKKVYHTQTPLDKIKSSFLEINSFIEKKGKEPEENTSDILEFQLYSRLKNIRNNPEYIDQLKEIDEHNILNIDITSKIDINSIDDILNDTSLDSILSDHEGLFTFNHVPKDLERAQTDFVARRKPCKNFMNYEEKLKEVQQDLREGKRKLVDFKQQTLKAGRFYVHNGVLFLLEKINISRKDHYKDDGTRVRRDGRTKCIFENGTESNMLMRSIEKLLYSNGKVVSDNSEVVIDEINNSFNNITTEDKDSGYIYVLKSKSTKPEIASIQNLYKIGYSTTEVIDRIKNAKKEPTYLMDEVEHIASWKLYNYNAQAFENLMHKFFGSSCLDLEIYDEKNKIHKPREWFIVPLEIIREVVKYINDGSIVDLYYDPIKEKLVYK